MSTQSILAEFDKEFKHSQFVDYAKIKSFLEKAIGEARQEERKRILELLMSGKGRETGVWHYEINDIAQMEASWHGDFLDIEEVKKVLSLKGE